MTAIDEMDIIHYFEVLSYENKQKDTAKTGFIDDVM
jgi:hypothetical protein